MDQPRWIPQLYGYVVCLIAVITILISLNSLVNNLFEYSEPGMSREISGEFGGRSLEACKQRYMTRPGSTARPTEPSAVGTELPADSVLMRLCAEEREDRVVSVRHRALRSLVTSTLMLLVAGVLFGAHWRWLRGSRVAMT
ncbi:MAG: hypothetical protein ACR2GJ_09510 [Gemmatimonadaceae bacterium]|jgi:hypothetical protein